MKRLIYSAKAIADLGGVLRYIARDDPEAAVRFVDAIEATCETLQQSPGIGERKEDLSPGLRRFSFRSYVIYYRDLDNQVRIERVLHGAQNTTADLFED